MKKITINIFCLLLVCIFSSCDDFLDIVPDNVATIDHAFSDRVSAQRYLASLYSLLPYYGNMKQDPAILATDEVGLNENPYYENDLKFYGNRMKQNLQNTNSPYHNFWDGSNEGRGLFVALRECNAFLENIHKVGPDLSEQERTRWIAEAKVLKAFYHFYLLRMYGAIPLIRESLPVGTSVDEVKVYRDPFDEGIDYVVELCNEAIPDLPLDITDISTELGRLTKPAAAMLKAQALVLKASPLFNGNQEINFLKDNRGVYLFSQEEDPAKWVDAAEACKEAIEFAHQANIQLYTYKDIRFALSDTTRLTLGIRGVMTEKWNEEHIWSCSRNNVEQYQKNTFLQLILENQVSSPNIYPDFKMAELFYSAKGVPIDEDRTYDYNNRYDVTTVGDDHYFYIKKGLQTAILNTYREPRFYGSMSFDTNYWYGNGRTKDVGTGSDSETPYIIAGKSGEVSGKRSNLNYTRSGYYLKKVINLETYVTTSGNAFVRYTFPIMRLGDLYLLYAEALNESLSEPTGEVYKYIDLVRERSGLKGVVESWKDYSNIPDKPATQTGMRQIIRQERMIELCFEGVRFWDVKRWKLCSTYYNHTLKGWNVSGATTDEYYQVVNHGSIEFRTRDYLWPISENELRRNPNLVQNPYWE